VLHSFTGTGGDGEYPLAGLIRDASGNLYGTTEEGGAYSYGTVFKLGKHGKETVLYSFTGEADGAYPVAGLVQDAKGNLYGTTVNGGDFSCYSDGEYGCGVVFKLDKTGKETVLHTFSGSPDGANPWASLIRDSKGNLYGTTVAGGTSGNYGNGTVFKVTATGTETVLYTFPENAADGSNPYGGLVRDAAGNLYGTTYHSQGGSGYGVVFKLDGTGTETVLYTFTDEPDGAYPNAGLVGHAKGNLYSTTFGGGSGYGGYGVGYGVVFEVTATGTETVLHTFGGSDGANPNAGLVQDAKGNLYGTTYVGGSGGCEDGCGVVFELTP
jgi:uncharacterized repeat protein (TIGR03803 family)